MKKIIFYLSTIAVVYYIIITIKILSFDAITNFGYGYLLGKIVLLIVFGLISYFSGKETWEKLSPNK